MERARDVHDQLPDLERAVLTRISAAACAAALLLIVAGPAAAAWRQGGLELSASASIHNTFHHDGPGDAEWVQERNELELRAIYSLLGRGERRFGLRDATLSLLWRGRYDGIYDVRERYDRRGYDRNDFRFPEGKLPRELFLDLRFTGAFDGLSARLGKQQVVWGEADLFRSLDVVNPLRIDQNGIIGEDFDAYREPLWIAKFLYHVGNLGPMSQVGIEALYSANSRPLTHRLVMGEQFRIKFRSPLEGPNPRPVQLPFSRVRHPWELTRVGPDHGDVYDQAEAGVLGNQDVIFLVDDLFPKSTFDVDGSMVGVRVLGKVLGDFDVTLNWIYKRTDLPGTAVRFRGLFDPAIATDGSPNIRLDKLADAAAAEASLDGNGNGIPDGREELIRACLERNEPTILFASLRDRPSNPSTLCLGQEFWYPWTHVVGMTATYNDFRYTGAVFRLEQSFSTKEPRNAMRPAAGNRSGEFPTERDFATNLMRSTPVWRSMVGFDLLRAFRWMPLTRSDPWFLTFQFLNEYYAHTEGQMGMTGSITDRMHRWNPLFTFLATGFFMNSRLRPTLAAGWDPVVDFPFFWFEAEYHWSKRVTLRAGEILYAGSSRAESFVFLHHYADRDTFFVKLTYWLL